ncbi:MAG: transglutaminase domain-containing protein [Clostridia bacterium]|nr:transglutaminase domain-containing protein [Clostridia bacterium]
MKIARWMLKPFVFLIISSFFFCIGGIFPSGQDSDMPPVVQLNPRESILQDLEAHASCIDTRAWQLTAEEIMDIFQELIETRPGLFFVFPKLSYAYEENGLVTEIYPQYRIDPEETEAARYHLLEYTKNFANAVYPRMSDGDKALLIHDHLADQYRYSPPGEENYDTYSLWAEGHGVCQAFSLMYILLGEAIGLEVDLVTSDSMDHAWNHVKVDGNFYHVDVTRDLSNESKHYSHDRFLLCDIGMKNKGYTDFSCHARHICNVHTYEVKDGQTEHESLMRDVVGESVYIGSSWLSNIPQQGLAILVLFEVCSPENRLTSGADLDGNGMLSLADLILLQAHCHTEVSYFMLSSLINALLEKALQ